MVRIVFLGVGGWVSDPLLGYTSILVESDGKILLIEAGEGLYRSLRLCGYDVSNIDYVVVTHRHGDHIMGLPTLLLMSSYTGSKRLRIYLLRDALDSLRLILKAVGLEHVSSNAEIIEVDNLTEVWATPFKLSFIEAVHTVPALSVKIEVNGRCIVYSGDTAYNPRLAVFARDCDVLIHEVSTYSSEAHKYGHSSYVDAFEIASRSNVRILIPIHFYRQPLPVDTSYMMCEHQPKIFMPIPCSYLEL